MTGTVCNKQDLSQLTGIPIGKVECLLSVERPVCSLDSWVPDGRGGTEALAEQLLDSSDLDPADALFHLQMKAQVRAVLGTLEVREAQIIAMRFGIAGGGAKTLAAVAETYGMTRERIRQIEVTAMEKLRYPSRSDALRQYQFDCETQTRVSPKRSSF
jgi:DNA-directed RNA polymerase sigma subunit (sigma70/sigma32)